MVNRGRWQRVFVHDEGFKLPEYTWDKDRERCQTCAYLVYRDPAMHCTKIKELPRQRAQQGRKRIEHTSCIDMRTKNLCGKQARYWKAAK